MLTTESVHLKKGIMYTLAGIFKHGQRDYLMTSASSLLHQILGVNFSPYELAIVKKPLMKLIQRIGKWHRSFTAGPDSFKCLKSFIKTYL